MKSYRCTLKFADAAKTQVVAPYDTDLEQGKFFNGDDITFTSADGKWRVIFIESPLSDTGDPLIINGGVNDERRFFFNIRGDERKFPFRCLIDKDGQPVGWDSAGNDPNVKSTRP